MTSRLRQWMKAASRTQQDALARLAKTSRQMLYQLSSKHRSASAAKAILFERAARRVPGAVALPELRRGDLCEACRTCDYARRCLAMDKELSE